MLRIRIYASLVVYALVLTSALSGVVRAQATFQPPIEMAIEGEVPEFKPNSHLYIANDDEGTTWYIYDGSVWSFHPDSLKWTRWPDVRLDDVEVQMGYDSANDRFLFWNGGVGKVFTWTPGDSVVVRIDKSFHHRTQFGHSWFIHPESGEIYAFGGYGFWQSRGYTARFDMKVMEWLVVPLDGSKPYPSPRAGAKHTFDVKRGQFHIFGGHNYRNEGREDLSVDFEDFDDYWVLDIMSREWQKKPIYGLKGAFELDKEIRRTNEIFYFAVVDHENDLAWYPARSTEGAYDIRMLVFDYSRGFGTYTPISLGELGNKSNIRWFSYDSRLNRLLVYWVQAVNVGNDHPVRVSALQLPPPDSTRAMMDMIRLYGSVDPPDKASNWWLILLLIPILGGTVWYLRRNRRLIESASQQLSAAESEFSQMPLPSKPIISICFVGQPRLLIDGVEVRNHIGEAELNLMIWLYWRHRMGDPFQITDNIEQAFWHDSPNLDYVRKQRNTTIRRLNEQLSELLGKFEPGHTWVVDRASITDKRKREYALDLNGLPVNCDLDDEQLLSDSAILDGCKGAWADQIRKESALKAVVVQLDGYKAGA